MTTGGSFKRKFSRWLDECKLAASGIALATRRREFLLGFVVSFVIFGTLMSLLSSSTAPLGMFWSADFGRKMAILWQGFLGIFVVDGSFWLWLLNFFIIIMQSVLIGLVVLVWRKRRRSKKEQVVATASNIDNIEHASVAAGLAVLGSGCPTCGTTLLAPMLGTLFSASGYALASTISGALTAVAVLVALYSLKKLGNDAYALLVSERFAARHRSHHDSTATSAQTSTVNNSKQES